MAVARASDKILTEVLFHLRCGDGVKGEFALWTMILFALYKLFNETDAHAPNERGA